MEEKHAQLKHALEELHTALQHTKLDDEEMRQLLQAEIQEMQAALTEAEEPPEPPQSVTDRFTQAVEHFEVSHPAIAGVLTRILDLLDRTGI